MQAQVHGAHQPVLGGGGLSSAWGFRSEEAERDREREKQRSNEMRPNWQTNETNERFWSAEMLMRATRYHFPTIAASEKKVKVKKFTFKSQRNCFLS